MEIRCPLTYKYPGAEQVFSGECIALDGSGITFVGNKNIEPGLALEINLPPENTLKLTLQAFVEVLGCTPGGAATFEIVCDIKGIT